MEWVDHDPCLLSKLPSALYTRGGTVPRCLPGLRRSNSAERRGRADPRLPSGRARGPSPRPARGDRRDDPASGAGLGRARPALDALKDGIFLASSPHGCPNGWLVRQRLPGLSHVDRRTPGGGLPARTPYLRRSLPPARCRHRAGLAARFCPAHEGRRWKRSRSSEASRRRAPRVPEPSRSNRPASVARSSVPCGCVAALSRTVRESCSCQRRGARPANLDTWLG